MKLGRLLKTLLELSVCLYPVAGDVAEGLLLAVLLDQLCVKSPPDCLLLVLLPVSNDQYIVMLVLLSTPTAVLQPMPYLSSWCNIDYCCLQLMHCQNHLLHL